MKKTILALLLCLFFTTVLKAMDLLSDKAFDRLVIQDITYAIFGESTL